MRDPGLERSHPRRRRRQRTRAPDRYFAAVRVELEPRSGRARAHCRGSDRHRPQGPAARSLRRARARPATSTRSIAARAQEYALLATLLARAPDAKLLAQLAGLRGDATPLGVAHAALARGRQRDHGRARRARVLQSLHRARPRRTAALRLVLSHRLPARAPAGAAARRSRPRSASSAPKATTSRRITPRPCARSWRAWSSGRLPAPQGTDQQIFEKHLAPWIGRFFADLERAEAADFYRRIGTLGRVFMEIETEAFALPS